MWIAILIIIILLLLAEIFALLTMCRRGHSYWKLLRKYRYAHRGYHGKDLAPENSILAYKEAIRRGFGVELDVHLMQDGNLAVIHDASLLRTAGADVLHLGVIGVGGAKSSGPATFSSREATGFSMENSVSSYAMASAPAVANDTMNESSAAAGGADTGAAVLTSGELESAGESTHAAENSKIIYTANLTLESKDYDAARAALDAALAEAGGYMESSDEYANSGSTPSVIASVWSPRCLWSRRAPSTALGMPPTPIWSVAPSGISSAM